MNLVLDAQGKMLYLVRMEQGLAVYSGLPAESNKRIRQPLNKIPAMKTSY